jgi:hypothetical protein
VIELAAFLGAVAVIFVVGIGLGILVAPRLTRWAERDDDDADDEPDGQAAPREEPRDDRPG